jgi:uncharacterized protein (UPF0333 family)
VKAVRHKGQSFLEFVFLIAVIIAGIILTQIYIKRGMQGGLRNAAKQIGAVPYAPGQASSSSIETKGASIEYTGVVQKTAIKYPHMAISVEHTEVSSQEETQIGSLKKDMKSDTDMRREGSELTDNDYVEE